MNKNRFNALLSADVFQSDVGLTVHTPDCTKPGFYLANDSKFLAGYFSEPLTTFAVGWKDPENYEAWLAFLAPEVLSGRRFEYKSAVNSEQFLSDTDDERPMGGDFKQVQYSGTDKLGKTVNRGLCYVLDLDEAAPGVDWETRITSMLQQRILRNEGRRSWAALTAAATNTAKTWNSSADPDQDIADDRETGGDASGIQANRIVIGRRAWNLRRKSLRAQNNAGSNASAAFTPDDMADDLGVDKVWVSNARYQSAAATKSQIVANKVLSYYAVDGVSQQDPSNIKRFVTNHSTEQGGGRWQVYKQQLGPKLIAISVGMYSAIVVPFSTGIRSLTIS